MTTKNIQEFMYGYRAPKHADNTSYHLVDRSISPILRVVISKIGALPTSTRVLDLGCGDGFLERHANHRKYAFTSIDIEPAAIEALQTTFKADKINQQDQALIGDIVELGRINSITDKQYDAIISWRVLHGIEPSAYGDIFRNIYSLLKHGSSFYISVACDRDWKAKALGDQLNREGINDCTTVMFNNYGIERTTPFPVHFFTKDELMELGKIHGFRPKEMCHFQETSGYDHLKNKNNTYLFAEFVKY